ncbi:MAG: response regulator transcription factor [Deltaproteobacteria bacterium]|nr:response regulator transcription factor [Deltaproteobacteria bacterium]
MRILLVEDERVLGDAVAEELRDELYAVDLARDGEGAAELMDINEYDAVVLDRQIPPPSGLELLSRWRQDGVATPVLMLTAQSSVDDRVGGLDAGADDYLAKPFQFSELKARLRSLLRRSPRSGAAWIRSGELSMDPARRLAKIAGNSLDLSAKEFSILECLAQKPGEVIPRQELVNQVWEEDLELQTNVLQVFIHRLRRKLAEHSDQALIETVKGVGYRFSG